MCSDVTEAEVAGAVTAHLGHALGGRADLLARLAGVRVVMHGASFRRYGLAELARAAYTLQLVTDGDSTRAWLLCTAA